MIGQSLSLVTGESSEFARRERSVGTIKPLLIVVAIVFGIGFAGVLSAEHFTEPDCPKESCLVSLSNLLEAADTKEQSPPDSYSLNSFGPPLAKSKDQQNPELGYMVRAPPKLF